MDSLTGKLTVAQMFDHEKPRQSPVDVYARGLSAFKILPFPKPFLGTVIVCVTIAAVRAARSMPCAESTTASGAVILLVRLSSRIARSRRLVSPAGRGLPQAVPQRSYHQNSCLQ